MIYYSKNSIKHLVIIIGGFLFALWLVNISIAAKNRSIMIDSDGENVTGVTNFIVQSNLQVDGVTLFGTKPTAGQFVKLSSDGLQLEGATVDSSVTGGGGINSGNYGQIPYYSNDPSGTTLSALASSANSVLTFNSSSTPVVTSTLPDAVQTNITKLGTLSQGLTGTTATFTSEVTVQGEANFESSVSAIGVINALGGVTAGAGGASGVSGQFYPENVDAAGGGTTYNLNDIPIFSQETQTDAGAAGVTAQTTLIVTTASGNTEVITLQNGVAGQIKNFVFITDGGSDVHITPTNFTAGTSIWMANAGYGCSLIFDGTNWNILGTAEGGVTIQ